MAWHRWEAQFGPLGPGRGDVHAAQIAYYVIKTMGGKKARRIKFGDVLLEWDGGAARHEQRLAAAFEGDDDEPDDDDETPDQPDDDGDGELIGGRLGGD